MLLPESFPLDVEATESKLGALVESHSRVWLTPQLWPTWDAEAVVEKWLDAHAERVKTTQVDKFQVVLYHTLPEITREMVPLDARVGDGVRLLGYVLRDAQGQAVERAEVKPGDELRLSLYWQAERPIDAEYVVFVHLLDETGWLRGQQDNQPRRGTFPTRAWIPGDLVVDAYTVPVAADAPPGTALLEIGMYDPASGERLQVTGVDADRVQRRVVLRDRVAIRP
jgi:hypothetical protein